MKNSRKKFIEYVEYAIEQVEDIGIFLVAIGFIYLIIHLLKAFL